MRFLTYAMTYATDVDIEILWKYFFGWLELRKRKISESGKEFHLPTAKRVVEQSPSIQNFILHFRHLARKANPSAGAFLVDRDSLR
ncbi:MAG: hypothetical protein DMG49_00915 [Acidobacteria bacterium]|nr:MAG: hypothetical protein DMG49_00915 [Acidobacteriota bacterium]